MWYDSLICRPRIGKSHSGSPRTAWSVVNMFPKNGMGLLIRTNGTIFYSILNCNLRALHSRLKYVYSVISVIVDWLPGNTKNWAIDKFVAIGVRFFHSWTVVWVTDMWYDSLICGMTHCHSRRNQTQNIWISRSFSFPDRSFECRGLRLLTWKFVWKFVAPVKTCLICAGTPVKTRLKIWQ